MPKSSNLSFCAVVLVFLGLIHLSDGYPKPLPYEFLLNLGSREFRYHHYLFHNIRNSWLSLTPEAQAEIASYGWEPPRPSKDANGSTLSDNGSGEDFLYMHRQMINMANRVLDTYGYPPLTSWPEIPMGNDTNYPMPPLYVHPDDNITSNLLAYYKTEDWYIYAKRQEAHIKDPNWLRTITLGQLGAYIEFSSDIHQGMHYRFSKYNPLMRLRNTTPIPYVNPRFDVMTSNWLPDLYSSHCNPWFFKLHGWINDRIDDWAAANGITEIQWNGTWTGGSMDTLPDRLNFTPNYPTRYLRQDRNLMDMEHMDMQMPENQVDQAMDDMGMHMGMGKMNVTAMEAVIAILKREGVACDTYGELNSNNRPPFERLRDPDFYNV